MRSVMNRWMTALLAAALLATLPAAQADVVIDWHDTAMASFAQTGMPLLPATRTLALTHAAMFDALNAVERRHMPYGSRVEAAPGTSGDAAASAAAHKVLGDAAAGACEGAGAGASQRTGVDARRGRA